MDRLFLKRAAAAWKSGLRYAALALGGSAIGMIIAISFIAMYYKQLLDWLPGLPFAAPIVSALIAAWTVPSAGRTFLKEADLALLVPSAYPMRRYLRAAYGYSLTMHALRQAPLLMLLYPVFLQTGAESGAWAAVASGIVLGKLWNADLEWRLQLLGLRGAARRLSVLLRWLAGTLLLHGLWTACWSAAAAVLAGMLAATAWAAARRRNYRVPWLLLAEQERRRVEGYYALVNGFVDVPYERRRTRTAAGLVRLADRVLGGRRDAAAYALNRTFARSGETLGMFVRAAVVSSLIVYALESRWATVVACFAALALTGGQLAHQLRAGIRAYPPSLRLLPIGPEQLRRALLRLCFAALTSMSLLLAVLLLAKPEAPLAQLALALACGVWSGLVSLYAARPERAERAIPPRRE